MTSPKSRWAIGLISGTSMDGIDAALIRLSGPDGRPSVRLRAFRTVPYPKSIREVLMRVASGAATTAGEISDLNFILGERFAAAALAVCRLGGISPSRVSVIGSHGQTIFHRGPALRLSAARNAWLGASTLQIGEPAIIAERTGAPVVADFRPPDMGAGGHGAPLVPMVDYLLLRDAKRGIVALNLGGIANVTVLSRGGRLEDVFGFDTGPGNIVVDALVRRFTHGRKRYDAGGRWASRGRVMERLLAAMLADPFLKQSPPKSAGHEEFGAGFVAQFFPNSRRVNHADALRTATELTARSVTEALQSFVIGRVPVQRLVLSGGGAHNSLLRARLTDLLPGVELRLSDDFGLPVDAKEAVAFAVLADRTLRGLPGNIPAVTGARRPVALGTISRPGAACPRKLLGKLGQGGVRSFPGCR